jgi:hypothetical protein
MRQAQVRWRLPWYLDPHRGIDEQNPKQVQAFVQEVCRIRIINVRTSFISV